jgi:hypothetical protein
MTSDSAGTWSRNRLYSFGSDTSKDAQSGSIKHSRLSRALRRSILVLAASAHLAESVPATIADVQRMNDAMQR